MLVLVLAPVLVLELASSAPVLASESGFEEEEADFSAQELVLVLDFVEEVEKEADSVAWEQELDSVEEVEEEDSFAP